MYNLTDDGRSKAQRKMREQREGWPKVTTTWKKRWGTASDALMSREWR